MYSCVELYIAMEVYVWSWRAMYSVLKICIAVEGYIEWCRTMNRYRYARACKAMNSFGGLCIVA